MVLHHNIRIGRTSRIYAFTRKISVFQQSGIFQPHPMVNGDGLGGAVKRLAARASLQRPYNDQIM